MEIVKNVKPRTKIRDGMANDYIPALIHQTFETPDVPQGMYDAAQSWVNLNPDFEYRFFDAPERRDFIEKHFGAKVVSAYDKLTHGAFRADLWRYCQLYVDGGVYSDLDQVCMMPLANLLEKEDSFVAARAGNLAFAISNGFICSRPQHPFMEEAINRSVDIILGNDVIDGYMTTGPWNLGVSVNKCLGRAQQSEHLIGTSGAGELRLRLLEKRPKKPDAPGYLSSNGEVVLLTEYEGYRNDLVAIGVKHWQEVRPTISIIRKVKNKIRKSAKHLLGKNN